jgi:hypothetical protein
LESTGQHRVDDDAVAVEVNLEELAPSADAADGLSHESGELVRGAADGEWAGGLCGGDPTAAEGRIERLGDDRQVGQFGHGSRS